MQAPSGSSATCARSWNSRACEAKNGSHWSPELRYKCEYIKTSCNSFSDITCYQVYPSQEPTGCPSFPSEKATSTLHVSGLKLIFGQAFLIYLYIQKPTILNNLNYVEPLETTWNNTSISQSKTQLPQPWPLAVPSKAGVKCVRIPMNQNVSLQHRASGGTVLGIFTTFTWRKRQKHTSNNMNIRAYK